MIHRGKWKEEAGSINTLRCRLTERILSFSCWMEQQRIENNVFVLLLVLAKLERVRDRNTGLTTHMAHHKFNCTAVKATTTAAASILPYPVYWI